MAKPPEVPANELFAKLLERPAPSEVAPFPRLDENGDPLFDVRIFVLTQNEREAAMAAARKRVKELIGDDSLPGLSLDEMLGDQTAKELLARAVHQDQLIPNQQENEPPRYARLFANAHDVGRLTSDEVACLFGAYLLVQRKYGPVESSFESEREINAWVERLAEGANSFPLALLQSHQRDTLLGLLAQRLWLVCQTLTSRQSDSDESLASLLGDWLSGTSLSTEPAAEPIHSQNPDEEPITPERAIEMTRALQEQVGTRSD